MKIVMANGLMANWGCDSKYFCLIVNRELEFCHRFRYLVAEGF